MTERKTYGSLDSDLAQAIMNHFDLHEGYVYGSRTDIGNEWKVKVLARGRRRKLGSLKEILDALGKKRLAISPP